MALIVAVLSTVKEALVTVAAAFPARSLTSAVKVSLPSDKACKCAAGMVTVAALELTLAVYVRLFKVMVTACPFSTPLVVTETVPSLLSSVALR